MAAASPRPRFNIHAFILGWLCFVTLPGLLACAVPERVDGAPAFRSQSHVGKAVRPEMGLNAAPLPLDHRKENAGSKRPEPALATALAAVASIPTTHSASDRIEWPSASGTHPAYRSRAPPRA